MNGEKLIKRMFSYAMKNKVRYILSLLIFTFQDMAITFFVIFVKKEGINVALNNSSIILFVLKAVFIYMAINVITAYGIAFVEQVNNHIDNAVRRDIMKSIFERPLHVLDKGLCETVLINDVPEISNFCTVSLGMLFMPFFSALICVIWSFFINWNVGMLILGAVSIPILYYIVIRPAYNKHVIKRKEGEQKEVLLIRTMIDNNQMSKTFMLQDRIVGNYMAHERHLVGFDISNSFIIKIMRTAGDVSRLVFVSLFFLLALGLYVNGKISIAEIVIAPEMIISAVDGAVEFCLNLIEVKAPIVSAQRVFNLIDGEEKDTVKRQEELAMHWSLSENSGLKVEGLCFAYDKNRPIFNEFSFNTGRNGIVLLNGEVGKGKSTLIKLILGIEKEQRGHIVLFGKEKPENVENEWLNNFSYVDQESTLLHMTLKDNLLLGKDVEDSRINEVIEKLGISCIINRLEKGMDTVLGSGKIELSGGEKQLVALARAILSDAKVLILDEPTSALDEVHEKCVIKMLEVEAKKRLILLITHRDSMKKYAKQVVNV